MVELLNRLQLLAHQDKYYVQMEKLAKQQQLNVQQVELSLLLHVQMVRKNALMVHVKLHVLSSKMKS